MESTASNVERAILAQLDNPASELVRRVTECNQIVLHNYRAETPRACICGLLGCERGFAITLIPNQALYPKFCEQHRSEHRRRLFLERFTTGDRSSRHQVRVFSAPT